MGSQYRERGQCAITLFCHEINSLGARKIKVDKGCVFCFFIENFYFINISLKSTTFGRLCFSLILNNSRSFKFLKFLQKWGIFFCQRPFEYL